MEIYPYRPMVATESPKMLIGGAIGDRCEISKVRMWSIWLVGRSASYIEKKDLPSLLQLSAR